MSILKRYRLEFFVFIAAAGAMILELDGSRIVAPYLGTSLVVWTSLIGVILAALASGYAIGGRLADQKADFKGLARFFLNAAILVALIPLLSTLVLHALHPVVDLRMRAVLSALLLFAAPTVFLAMVSPYAVKLRLSDMAFTGRAVGNLSAVATTGSIVGTFVAGFILIQYFGNQQILFTLAVLLLMTAAIARGSWRPVRDTALLFLVFFASTFVQFENIVGFQQGIAHFDTAYAQITIVNGVDAEGRLVREMHINNENSSARYLDSTDLVYPYTRYYQLAPHFVPNLESVLVLGGAGYSYPNYFLHTYPGKPIDVVEIDPGVTSLAQQFFGLNVQAPGLRIFNEDGRLFLNESQDKYSAIIADAFHANTVPYQLTTVEAAQEMSAHLKPDGAVLLNIISAVDGIDGQFAAAEYATFKQVFPQVYILPVQNPQARQQIQNIIMVALKSSSPPSWEDNDTALQGYLQHVVVPPKETPPVLTDNFAPIDRYTADMQQKISRL